MGKKKYEDFLSGGGEMGALIRDFDWENSALGSPDKWPLSLHITLATIVHSAFPMFLFWDEDHFCFYNDAYRPSLGQAGKHPMIGKKGKESWTETWEFIGPLIEKVKATGESFKYEDMLVPIYRNGSLEDVYWTFTYSPAYGDLGEIRGVIVTCMETTEKMTTFNIISAANEKLRQNENLLQQSRDQLQFAIDAAELGTWELDPVTNKFRGNSRLKEWFGLQSDDEIQLSSGIQVIAEKDRKRVSDAISYALSYESGGNYDIEYTIENPVSGKEIIVKAKGKAIFNAEKLPYAFNGTLEDITEQTNIKQQLELEAAEQKIAKQKLEEAELFSRDIFENSPVAKLVLLGPEMKIDRINEYMLEILGRDRSVVGLPFYTAIPELMSTEHKNRLEKVYNSGETFYQLEEEITILRSGVPYTGYYNYAYKALSLSDAIYGIIVTATEVSRQVESRRIIEAKEKELRDLITAAPIGICVVSGDPVWAEEINDRFLLISGKTREQYATKPYWEVLKEVEATFKPELDKVFQTGEKYSTEEHEMLLIRDGIEENIYLTFDYIPLKNKEGITIKVIILVVEVTHQVETRRKIELAVEERTKELAEMNYSLMRSNAELEQFAYIASHDLQEPVRKISTFLEMLHHSLGDISEKSEGYFKKILNSTNRMTQLIRDVLAYSKVSENNDAFVEVNLNSIIETIKTDFELSIASKGAIIKTKNLPVIEGIPSQLVQLFSNLLSNSLKFAKPDITPIIQISAVVAGKKIIEKYPELTHKEYYHLQFKDNGIGFDQDYADRIFKIFQRLHNKMDYEGTGIGLSICRKIVQTHKGHISASSSEDGGATFHILFPKY
ncbi:ATP-binding protein [Flavobacterium sp. ARAG 55.4]|uniref:ATP-binding protein n=1 Tax=Flavobacterium sp. ARAG 55.4 TaxID=3451357 RepID=UPI003F453899